MAKGRSWQLRHRLTAKLAFTLAQRRRRMRSASRPERVLTRAMESCARFYDGSGKAAGVRLYLRWPNPSRFESRAGSATARSDDHAPLTFGRQFPDAQSAAPIPLSGFRLYGRAPEQRSRTGCRLRRLCLRNREAAAFAVDEKQFKSVSDFYFASATNRPALSGEASPRRRELDELSKDGDHVSQRRKRPSWLMRMC